LFVAKSLTDAGFRCFKSLYFSDEESNKAREIDIVASLSDHNERGQSLDFKLVIECKKSSSAFIVVCDDETQSSFLKGVFFANLYTNSEDDLFVCLPFFNARLNDYTQLFPTPLLKLPIRRGYTLLQAHAKGDSEIYSEIYKLAKAYEFEKRKEIEWRDDYRSKPDFASELQNLYFANVPVLAVDAPLVEVFLDQQGQLRIEQTELSSLKIRLPWTVGIGNDNPDEGLSIVIVTKSKIVDFAIEVAAAAREILRRHQESTPDPLPAK
jgi:hypothetical protein